MEICKKGGALSPEEGAHTAQKELRLKDEGHEQLFEVWEHLEQELEELLMASLSEGAHKMV